MQATAESRGGAFTVEDPLRRRDGRSRAVDRREVSIVSMRIAVVSDILTDRVIRVTHANWGGSRGRVEENVTVVDVSEGGDWSRVKVWYAPIHDLGTTVYPTYGFIYKGARDALDNDSAATTSGQP